MPNSAQQPATSDAPAPLVRSDVNCADLDWFMLNVERLMASELVALSSHEVIGAALLLWCRAWKQAPAASLPDDEKVIAAFARMPLARFRKLRAEVMRGFVLCSDGRWYHKTLAAEAVNAYARKVAFQRKRETDAERLRKWRSGNANETRSETRFVAEVELREDTVTSSLAKKAPDVAEPAPPTPPAPAAKKASPRGTRLPADWQPGPAELEFAASIGLANGKATAEAEKFRDYWHAKAGAAASKTDWLATWRNWCREAVARVGKQQTPAQGSTGRHYEVI